MLEILKGILSSALAGGATGLLGGLLSTWGELSKMRELHRHEEDQRKIDLLVAEKEAEGKISLARTEGEIKVQIEDVELQKSSMELDKATYSSTPGVMDKLKGWWGQLARFLLAAVDVTRGFIRPALTLYFAGLLSYIAFQVLTLFQAIPQAEQTRIITSLMPEVINDIMYLSTTILLWWFGVRQKAK